jgi:hypothetical protein
MGEMAQPFRASDDYGVVVGDGDRSRSTRRRDAEHGLAAEPDPREPLVLDLPMPFGGDRAEFEEKLVDNLSEHPFANLPVTITLTVRTPPGRKPRPSPRPCACRAAVLPARGPRGDRAAARHPLVAAKRPAGDQVLRAIANRPEELFPGPRALFALSYTIRRLDRAGRCREHDTRAEDEIAKALWDLAIQLEDGRCATRASGWKRAQERLAEAMRNGGVPARDPGAHGRSSGTPRRTTSACCAERSAGEEPGTDEPQTSQGGEP